jgi:hypothetical protein
VQSSRPIVKLVEGITGQGTFSCVGVAVRTMGGVESTGATVAALVAV